ncbi:RsmB/NOP family class I SAM-dependent RNA methyltransferase [Rhizobiales bacterium]|uniref:RsmB/NOP family class I SAM-dependent RNA methyltransferase n=1 Tax=Hongsoonwoonella zoysiae TaxID=2821844 RepID=UPI0015601F21|nr:RsmB/NOP family class I SAM-dependent RNA methyltransferase [Hongsoonwoonella zoysiae]NRG18980.1 RsmB/NOP family class I SAM-dependent RNA methyltransferase [Hongsoonwoonella zoysiae]
MKDGGRIAAAIDVLTDIESRRRPVQDALKDWGTSHRFAGSGDRVAIGNLVFDALRSKASLSFMMNDASPRSLALAVYGISWGGGMEGIASALEDDRHAPPPLSEEEAERLKAASLEGAPDWIRADVPEWLWPEFSTEFGEDAVTEGRSLASRAPIDMRLNRLKASREKLLKRLHHLGAEPMSLSPLGLRIAPAEGAGRMPHVQAEESFRKGWFELQDEASQIAALLAGAKGGDQVLDLCAGGGGKTLALAGEMENRGQIYAYDADRLRLAPIHERLRRAGVRNVQIRDPQTGGLEDLEARMDLVFADAPCSGTGVWRRRPDSKWRLSERALGGRKAEQRDVIRTASKYVRPGGRLVYVTCSLLPSENRDQLISFLEEDRRFKPLDLKAEWGRVLGGTADRARFDDSGFATLSPARSGTDGFFVSILRREDV